MGYTEESCSLAQFRALLNNRDGGAGLCHATGLEQNVPLYEAPALRAKLADNTRGPEIMAEFADVLLDGAGVFVIKQAFADPAVIDQATMVFNQIIEAERTSQGGQDHFARAGANHRIWNALEKLCVKAPDIFARYYGNDMIALAAEAWLGPAYQITSQINVVRPGGEAQQPHCDYHLGFLTAAEAARYPAHVHTLSPALTLQAGIAHCAMPVASGPTKILPFSQTYGAGYLAWRRADFRDYFEAHCVQVAMDKGDALFFNPSLFHAAGANTTATVERMANLLQISSAFGRAMERVDRRRMCQLLYPVLLTARQSGELTAGEISNAIAACAEGYAFPLSLDETPPAGGLAPKSQQVLMAEALAENQSPDAYCRTLA
ncbi:MAG: phytanoyl-CoA dioxygenase family protein [Rhodospirillales bacterium]|nr:phytanoyl-CoA dioxygenase family protein [Rhodospirillales bacterium]